MHSQTLSFAQPVDLARSVSRYTRWGIDPVNVVAHDRYHRITPDGTAYRAAQSGETRSGETRVVLDVSAGSPAEAEADLRHRLSDALTRPNAPALATPAIREMYDRMPGYRPPLVADPFEAVVTSITAQQVNLTWATTTRRRLVHTFGTRAEIDGIEVWAFPRAERLAAATVAELRALQFTTAKSEFIIGVARAAADGFFADLAAAPDAEVIDTVTTLRGVGRWTADWLLARCLGRDRAVAAGDLGVRKAVSRFVAGADTVLSEQEIRERVAPWGEAANWSVHLLLERLATQ